MIEKRTSLTTTGMVALIIFLLLISISSAYKYDRSKVTIQHVTTVGDNFDPEWSPDGSKIAYTSTEWGPNSGIWLVDADGGNRRMISQPGRDNEYSNSTWSPDGSKIAFGFHDKYAGQAGYICMNSDGTNVTKIPNGFGYLGNNTRLLSDLKWSPNGSKIMYAKGMGSWRSIWVMDSDGENRIHLTDRDSYNSTWSPDGTKIAYEVLSGSRKEIWIMDFDGSNQMRLMPQKMTPFEEPFSYFQPTFNPDGSKIVFVTNRFSEGNKYFDIVVLNLKDNSLTTLTDTRPRYFQPYTGQVGYEYFFDPEIVTKEYVRGDEFNPDWSPAGSKIAFSSEYDAGIWIMNSDGSNKIPLVASEYPGELIFNPQWSPDGSKILFERQYLGSRNILVITLGEAIISTPTPSPVTTVTPESTATLVPSPTETATPMTITTPSPTPTPPSTPTPTLSITPTPTIPEEKGIVGFEAVFAIAGLLAVAYFVLRRG